ncbi:MAG: fructosamine kinase family protein [Bacteroidota bacterium]
MLLDERLKSHIERVLNVPIISAIVLSGGDTASVLKLDTSDGLSYVLKYGRSNITQNSFAAEANGFDLISKTNTIATPRIIDFGLHGDMAYILMAHIASKSPGPEDFYKLGVQLSKLHKHNGEAFGLEHDNFIGSLLQKNEPSENWTTFYSEQRLGFQLKLALKKGLLNPSEIPLPQDIESTLESFCHTIKPTLLHGDLWSGNFIIAEDGVPYLIDPAVYYGHSEVDIAMSKLFGGFHPAFYKAYHNNQPITDYYNERIELYQLYYLLVHLNIFGRSYYGSVKRILKSYF